MPNDGILLPIRALSAKFEAKLQAYLQEIRVGGAKATEIQMRDVHRVIVLTSPVDTGRLRASWPLPTSRGSDLIWGTGTTLDYAPKLEYGGYTRVGPKTVRLGGGSLGYGFEADAGIYSQQAPLGFVRRALAGAAESYLLRLRNVIQGAWNGTGIDASVAVSGNRILGETE